VEEGVKYVIRTDVIYRHDEVEGEGKVEEEGGKSESEDSENLDDSVPFDARLTAHDDIVRDTLNPHQPSSPLPTSVYEPAFLEVVSPLYEPVMGAENLGYLLHSLVRFLKPKVIMEIGAGYTSLYILQALRENEIEMERVKDCVLKGRMKLLDYPWTIEDEVVNWGGRECKLTVLDNCKHQKETASSAVGIARKLNLHEYLDFKVGDAYEANFEKESVDMLWCDFGVGGRMVEFMKSNWGCIKPGGYLVCHSTLTNLNTRRWTEGLRAGGGVDVCGIPAGDYEHISMLEGHKRFQNSVTIVQKRDKGYEEPIYSQYA
jgi:hypothetical protein